MFKQMGEISLETRKFQSRKTQKKGQIDEHEGTLPVDGAAAIVGSGRRRRRSSVFNYQ